MSSIKCPACEMEYSESHSKCPYCGTNSPLLTNKLRVVRDSHTIGWAASPEILIDGNRLGRLKNGETLETSFLPGKHVLEVITFSDNGKWITGRKRYEYIFKKSSKLVTIKIKLKTYVLKEGEFIVDSVYGL